MSRSAQAISLAISSFIVGIALCLYVQRLEPVSVPGHWWGTFDAQLQDTLDRDDSSGRTPSPGYERTLLRIRLRGGESVELIIKEGSFTRESVDPIKTWKPYLRNGYLLINPIDEYQSIATRGISDAFGHGCDLGAFENHQNKLYLGQIVFHRCSRPYSDNFGAGTVINVVTAISDSDQKDQKSCYEGNSEMQTSSCTAQYVQTILSHLFSKDVSSSYFRTQTWVLPALGTDHGYLAKADFYKLTADAMLGCLRSCDGTWPKRIILQVYRSDRREDWPQTKKDIEQDFGALAEEWKANGPHDAASASGCIAGVFLAISGCFFAIGRSSSILGSAFERLVFRTAPLPIFVAWLAASMGLALGVKQFAAIFNANPGSWLDVLVGAVTVFAVIPIMRANDLFKESVSANAPSSPPTQAARKRS